MKIYKERPRLNKRKNSLCHRVINKWNRLPQYVIQSTSVCKFEINLDKAWSNQDVITNYKTTIQSIPSNAPTNATATNQHTYLVLVASSHLDVQA